MALHKHFKKYFIPHEGNNYKPHLLREASVLFLAVLLLVIFLGGGVFVSVLTKTNFLAAIFSNVLVDLANANRATESLPALTSNQLLQVAAQMKANDMAAKGYFAHNSPEGRTPWYWIDLAGYNFTYAGENLAVNFADSEDVDRAWMNSPGHRANIMNKNFTEIGIATAQGTYQGQPTIFVVQMFGRPAVIPKATASLATGEALPSEPTGTSPVLGTETSPPAVIPAAPKQDTIPPQSSITPVVTETVIEGSPVDKTSEMFIAFSREEETPVSLASEDTQTPSTGEVSEEAGTALGSASYATWFEKLLSNPKDILTTVYVLLAFIILAALIFMLLIEVRRQHPVHFLYGLLLIAFIVILIYLNRHLLFPNVVVV